MKYLLILILILTSCQDNNQSNQENNTQSTNHLKKHIEETEGIKNAKDTIQKQQEAIKELENK